MNRLIETTKLQERGQLTIPLVIRERMGIRKGSKVAFVETDTGRFELRVVEDEIMAAFDEIGAALKKKGISIEELIAEGKKARKQLYKERYGKAA